VDDQRLGALLRALRLRRGWRQADVAARAHVSRAVVSSLERGHVLRVRLAPLRRVGMALDVRIDLLPRWRGGELSRLLDRDHAAVATSLIAHLGALGWISRPEVSFSVYGERGAVDVLAYHPSHAALLVIEVKTALLDLQDLVAGVDRKLRLAPGLAREIGWTPRVTGAWVVVSESRTARRRAAEHRDLLRAAFPADGRSMRRWLRDPRGQVRALGFWPNARLRNARADIPGRQRVRKPSPRSATAVERASSVAKRT
jgi:transcriptional regulator with XRE-family HTH domain